ncbi:MAG: NifB/NifX family molybdenum-iron cluster-binding protein [Patescibacteria group bacterium]|nr:NifB/NifX family molybdenum-iron cluster-binding protein [Patescibacteria group bacterium]
MKICITSNDTNLDSLVDSRFGRSLYFVLVEGKKKIKSIQNKSVNAIRGAGIQAAQIVSDAGAEIIITGNIGPKAFDVLNNAGIKVFQTVDGLKIKEALLAFEKGELKEIKQPFGNGSGRGDGSGRGSKMGRRDGSGRGSGRGGGFGNRASKD